MKNKKHLGLPLLMLGALVLTSCGGAGYETYPVTGDYMTGKTAKSVYNAYLGSAPTTLNPTRSQSAQNVQHLANLVGTLVMNDNYGILRKEIASSATRSSDNKVFSFGIRSDVPWVKTDGSIYNYKGTDQYVTADDFVTTAKIILDYKTGSEIYYMYTLFVSNAWEYYCYTMMVDFMNQGKAGYTNLKGNPTAQAEKIAELIKEYSGAEPESEIQGSDIAKIAKFERVGVEVDDSGKLVYTLKKSAQFFPTMLTYTPFTPTNQRFYSNCGEKYGSGVDYMLYCGPFRLTEFKTNSVKYVKNDSYYNKDNVHLKNVNYTVMDASTSYKDMREAFDRKEVDGFSLNKKDETGWEMYITGEDGKGTIQSPASDLVNSRELDQVDYTYHFNLNVNRSTDPVSYNKATYWDSELKDLYKTDEDKVKCIENTNRALKIKEVRKLVLNALDFDVYNEQWDVEDKNQYQMNTFTPRGYVFDEYGKDYTEYYYDEFASKKGLTGEGYASKNAEAKSLVGPQQTSGVNYLESNAASAEMLAKYPWLSLQTLRNDAVSAVQQLKAADSSVSFPVIIDYMGAGGINTDSLDDETKLVRSWNERANACTIADARVTDSLPRCMKLSDPTEKSDHYPYFEMVQDKISNQSDWESASNNGYYTIGTWGWIGDYADPLTYMHCYVTNGEMSKMSGNTDSFDSYSLDESGVLQKSATALFDKYNALVDEASEITTSNHERYAKFAEAEYMLLNELYIIKPSNMQTQGWSASVSRACGYDNPEAPYGLADNSLVGIWVLIDVPNGEERKKARDDREEKKAAALEAVGGNTIEPIFD